MDDPELESEEMDEMGVRKRRKKKERGQCEGEDVDRSSNHVDGSWVTQDMRETERRLWTGGWARGS